MSYDFFGLNEMVKKLEKKVEKLETEMKYKNQKWKLHKIMNFTYHLPIMRYIYKNSKRIEELEQKIGLNTNTQAQAIGFNRKIITKNKEKVDTLSAVMKTHVKWHIDKSPYSHLTIREQLEQLDGGGEPQLKKEFDEDIKKIKELEIDQERRNWLKSPEGIKCKEAFYKFCEKEEQEAKYDRIHDPITHKKYWKNLETGKLTDEKEEQEVPRGYKAIEGIGKVKEAEPFDIMQLGRRMSLIKHNKLMNELIADILKDWKRFAKWIDIQRKGILNADPIIEEIEKYEKEWRAKLKQ